jgi:thymidylate synthase (FAD)
MEKIKVLDFGYVFEVEHYGSDERVIEAARMSTAKGFLGWGPYPCTTCLEEGRVDEQGLFINMACRIWAQDFCKKCKGEGVTKGDEGLLKYLYDNKHHTPFEMAGMVIEVQAPILVFRQWQRHRTQSYNELSARYAELPDVFYIPSIERIQESAKASANKQASGKGNLLISPYVAQEIIKESSFGAYADYKTLLAGGMASELARCVLPVNIYSRMRVNANLRNWLAFLTLRMDPHAQWETRQFANVVGTLIEQDYPRTWELFLNHKTW